jgi:invasion protein IalB
MKNLALTKKLAFVITMVGITLPQLAVAEAKVGDRFGDWVYECLAIAENKTVCSLSQTIMSDKQNKRIVKFNLGRNEKTKSLDFVALLPLGIKLPAGVSLAIDAGKAYPLTIKTCIQQGCIATYPADSNFIKALQGGQKLNISFTGGVSDTPVTIAGSAKGLAEGVKAAGLN